MSECPTFHKAPTESGAPFYSDIDSFCTNDLFTMDKKTENQDVFFGHIYVFKYALVTQYGFLSTRSQSYDIGGCWNGMYNYYKPTCQKRKAYFLEEAIALNFPYAPTYYHLMIEVMSSLFLIFFLNPFVPIRLLVF